ncbi:hypothetical protein M9H77_13961 [Catharanthus roseus]|uniref:Uncharacterized protein n=1 Tax=Catharanthus roseus TaxID=4058 RepID=A0ACC0BLN7_CATRO|nr:hypothetical protein M9H77_13961 [Catharanthus roseus]
MTEELKPNGHQNCKWTVSSGNAASRHRKREESSGGAAESEGNQRVLKTPKDRELHRKRSNSINKKTEENGSPTDGPGSQPEPLGHPLIQSRK